MGMTWAMVTSFVGTLIFAAQSITFLCCLEVGFEIVRGDHDEVPVVLDALEDLFGAQTEIDGAVEFLPRDQADHLILISITAGGVGPAVASAPSEESSFSARRAPQ